MIPNSDTWEDHAYTSIDPGETIGWAAFNSNGDPIGLGQFRWEKEEFIKSLEILLPVGLTHCITEDYMNFANKPQKKWSKNNTSKVIGKIELFCDMRDIPVTLQPSFRYKVGCAWGGLPDPSKMNHSVSHQYAAAGHGIFWLQDNGIREPGRAMRKP